MTELGCSSWTSEYDWEVSLASRPRSRETMLCVLFDDGSQRQFSSVRISLLYSDEATPKYRKAWVRIFHSQCLFRLVDHSS